MPPLYQRVPPSYARCHHWRHCLPLSFVHRDLTLLISSYPPIAPTTATIARQNPPFFLYQSTVVAVGCRRHRLQPCSCRPLLFLAATIAPSSATTSLLPLPHPLLSSPYPPCCLAYHNTAFSDSYALLCCSHHLCRCRTLLHCSRLCPRSLYLSFSLLRSSSPMLLPSFTLSQHCQPSSIVANPSRDQRTTLFPLLHNFFFLPRNNDPSYHLLDCHPPPTQQHHELIITTSSATAARSLSTSTLLPSILGRS
ncbi:hypothetical protein GW17_00014444 [Ensete ventricosum]|nr:hypothetical protein GW17_00014444 [Ensete ventricosum]